MNNVTIVKTLASLVILYFSLPISAFAINLSCDEALKKNGLHVIEKERVKYERLSNITKQNDKKYIDVNECYFRFLRKEVDMLLVARSYRKALELEESIFDMDDGVDPRSYLRLIVIFNFVGEFEKLYRYGVYGYKNLSERDNDDLYVKLFSKMLIYKFLSKRYAVSDLLESDCENFSGGKKEYYKNACLTLIGESVSDIKLPDSLSELEFIVELIKMEMNDQKKRIKK